ncbi:MAG: DUF4440 domain-containing protein [Terriglobales bacterium]
MPAMIRARIFLLCGLVAALALGSACTVWKEKTAPSWSGATGAEQFERLLWRDVKAQHWADVEAHLAPSFVSVHGGGTRDRAETMKYLKSLTLTEYTLGDFSTTSNGTDFVVTYTARVTGTWQGRPLPSEPIHMMTVWQPVTKSWVAIAHSESQAMPSP